MTRKTLNDQKKKSIYIDFNSTLQCKMLRTNFFILNYMRYNLTLSYYTHLSIYVYLKVVEILILMHKLKVCFYKLHFLVYSKSLKLH